MKQIIVIYFIIISNAHLALSCDPGTYLNLKTQKCEKCMLFCLKCSSSTTCEQCDEPTNILVDGKCKRVCDHYSEYFDPDTQKCENCSYGCAACNRKNTCIACTNGYRWVEGKQRIECETICPLKTYYSTKKHSCIPCEVHYCKRCEGNHNLCQQCITGYILENDNYCNAICEPGEYYNDEISECQPCHYSCKTCLDKLSCQYCKQDYVPYPIQPNHCVPQCEFKQFWSFNTNKCEQCPEHCDSCLNENYCFNCESSYTNTFGKCEYQCMAPYQYWDREGSLCLNYLTGFDVSNKNKGCPNVNSFKIKNKFNFSFKK